MAASAPDPQIAAGASVESAQKQLAAAEHEVQATTQQAEQLAYAVVALRVQQADAQVALNTARDQARQAVRVAYDTASIDPTDALLASLNGGDPELATIVRDRRMTDAGSRIRQLQVAANHLDALSKDLARRRTSAMRAAADSLGAADRARRGLAAAEKTDIEVRTRAELAAQRRELDQLNTELTQTLEALYASSHPAPTPGAGPQSSGDPDLAGQEELVADSPAALRSLYQHAAATCPGLPWGVLAGIGQVETDNGRVKAVSSAGAMGPMQFLPATFAEYKVDGDGDGKADILDQADAVFTAAHYLCATGGGNSATLYDAIFAYNHSDFYVNTVLALAAQYH